MSENKSDNNTTNEAQQGATRTFVVFYTHTESVLVFEAKYLEIVGDRQLVHILRDDGRMLTLSFPIDRCVICSNVAPSADTQALATLFK